MSSYRYVVFLRGKQPTVGEVRELQSFAGLLANHFAWGVCRNDDRLAMACEASAFDHARQIDAGFDALIRKWEVRGCELIDHLGFVKDSTALRPVATPGRQPHDRPSREQPANDRASDSAVLRTDVRLAAKTMLGKEAIARSMLGVERTLERFAALQRLAAAMPYVLILLGMLGTIAAGVYVRSRVQNSGRERRHETIERLADDPLLLTIEAEPATPEKAQVDSASRDK